ncbi:MAG: hypothetical protein WA136_06570 [Rhodoferax sp.]
MKQRKTAWVLMACVAWGLSACARINDAGMAVFSSTVPAIAIVNGQLLQGEMQLYPDRTGVVTLRSDADVNSTAGGGASPSLVQAPAKGVVASCMGRMRYTATTTGTVDLRCNDGATADLKVTVLGETRGHGYGATGTGDASLVFGMAPAEARAHLVVPPNRQLVERAETPYLELK